MLQRLSRALIPTIKESPADATNASHILLLRAGYIRQLGAGIFNFLPLGLRVLHKIANVVREEMDGAGAHEVLMPAMLPAEYFKETGRWELYGDVLLRLKDRKGGDYHLGPTHEEIVTDMVRREVRSYRQLPLNLYQVQTKFRDEARPRAGILRCREFTMKDAYSFDVDEAAAVKSYEIMREAYKRIFTRLGLTFRVVQADSGAIGGKTSAEFQILADSGEDAIVACDTCDYAANVEAAEVGDVHELDRSQVERTLFSCEEVHTPGKGGIADVAKFLQSEPSQFIKSLLYTTPDSSVIMACIRGDHEVNEVKLAKALGVAEVHLAAEGDVYKATNAKVGYAGPVGFKGRIVIDPAAAAIGNAITGANKTDYHLKGVNFGRDFTGDQADLRAAVAGDLCPSCKKGHFKAYKGIEGGHIFILGTHYSSKMKAVFLDEKGEEKPIVMGCYGIGVSRLVASAVEQHHDADGIRWPASIAPYHVHLCTLGNDAAMNEVAEKLGKELVAAGLDVLWDDRDERPGVKFKDADLVGLPFRVTIGAKTLAQASCELKARANRDSKSFELVPLAGAAERIARAVREASAA
ncbi:MAG: proline--tRNA ligase, partial [Polyangiales bacterium]